MYHPKPIPPTLLRLISGAALVLQSLDSGDLFAEHEEARTRTVEAFQSLQIAYDLACTELPELAKSVSPFLRYRNEVLSQGHSGKFLRDIVMSLYDFENNVSLFSMYSEYIKKETQRQAFEMIESAMRNGRNDPFFVALFKKIQNEWSTQ